MIVLINSRRKYSANAPIISGNAIYISSIVPQSMRATTLDIDAPHTGQDASLLIQAEIDRVCVDDNVEYDIVYDCAVQQSTVRFPNKCRIIGTNYGSGAILAPNGGHALFEPKAGLSFTILRPGSSVKFIGGTWNGNGLNQHGKTNANVSVDRSDENGWIVGHARLFGVDQILYQNVRLYSPKSFTTHMGNNGDIRLLNNVVNVGNTDIISLDGWHFQGKINSIYSDGHVMKCADDAFGCNADDGYTDANSYNPSYYDNSWGAINLITIKNTTLNNSDANAQFGMRFLSGASRIENIVIDGVKGTTHALAILLDNFWQYESLTRAAGKGNIGTVTINNVDVNVIPRLEQWYRNGVVSVSTSIENLIMTNIKPSPSGVQTLNLYEGNGYTWGNISLNGQFIWQDGVKVNINY